MTTSADNPGVIVRPPLLFGGAFLAVLALRYLWPLPIAGRGITLWSGVALLLLAVAMLVSGRLGLRAAGTSVNPSRPTTAIATSGPYRFSRNPLYVGLTIAFLGLTLLCNTWWGVLLLVPVLVVVHNGVVLREERYLEEKFGETYRQYRAKVRRYL